MAQTIKRETARLCKSDLTQDRLKEILHYDPETGIFTRKKDIIAGRGRISFAIGTIAGTKERQNRSTYVKICIEYRRIYAHHAAFLYMCGTIPSTVDHIDCNGENNAWVNLRPATRSQNCSNARLSRANTSGIKGVSWSRKSKMWVANIKSGGPTKKQMFLGRFHKIEDAAAAYAIAARELCGEFARTE